MNQDVSLGFPWFLLRLKIDKYTRMGTCGVINIIKGQYKI